MASPKAASYDRFRRRRFGVYDVMYEDPALFPFTLHVRSLFNAFRKSYKEMPHLLRLLVDTIKLAPVDFTVYMMTTVWLGVYSAVNLYWLSVLSDNLRNGLTDGGSPHTLYWSPAASWLTCSMLNIAAGRAHARSYEILIKRFRMHFTPQLMRASLRVDLLPIQIQDLDSFFPVEGRFGSDFPGGPFLPVKCLSQLVGSTLCLIFQVLVLLHAISCKRSPEREIFFCVCVTRALVWWLAPSSGIGSSAYVYWPNNRHFQRSKTLFGLAFSAQYRASLVLDGMASSISTEYEKSTEKLGDIEVLDPTPWRVELLREWYWDFMTDTAINLPMVVYLLIPPARLLPSTVASIALLQQATESISSKIREYMRDTLSLLGVCVQAKRLYDAIEYQSTMPSGTDPFPRPTPVYNKGMKISFRHVSLQYPGSNHHALRGVFFDILPGELVLVVGTNGSGKSSMLKLLARLFDPTEGGILVDDIPLVRYEVDQIRTAVAFQSQSPVIYPVTVRENISFGLSSTLDEKRQGHLEEAARKGGCSEWISRLSDGYDTQLQSSFDVQNGWLDGVHGHPSKALMDELAKHKGRPVSISDGEKQRLATARTFMRLNDRETRLVIIDEATSSLDPVAERDILTAFREARAGKTIVLVTHRFHQLAPEADRILCMEGGRVVESGTHAQLVDASGQYAALYHAQVA